MLSQETTGHLKTSKALSLWSRFTKLPSYYSSLVLMSTSKILMLVSVWSHPHCVCVHTENSFDEISRRNSWPTNTMTTVPKGMKKKKDDMKPIMRMNLFMQEHPMVLHFLWL